MSCRMFDTKPFSEPVLTYFQLDPWEHSSVRFSSKYYILLYQENALENAICEMTPFVGTSMSNSMCGPGDKPKTPCMFSYMYFYSSVSRLDLTSYIGFSEDAYLIGYMVYTSKYEFEMSFHVGFSYI